MGPRLFSACIAALLLTLGLTSAAHAAGAANDHTVLILASTVQGGLASQEALRVTSLGYDIELATDAQWTAKSTADFSTYRAIILGDPVCASGATPILAAEQNVHIWGPAVDGNVLVIGTDPTHHMAWIPTAHELHDKGIPYVLATPPAEGRTGLYVTLACYFNETGASNIVEVLSHFGSFIVDENTNCHGDVHVTAPTHPAMQDITDADLSDWNCSIHALFTAWPANFIPLAIADGLGTAYTAPDGHVGTPYILARFATECVIAPSIVVNGVSPDTLWSPNHKMIPITVDADVFGTLVNVTATVTCSEVPKAPWTVFYEPGTDAFHFFLRSDRNGNNVGRTYFITFTGTDACGNVGTGTAVVVVPHDQRGKSPKIN